MGFLENNDFFYDVPTTDNHITEKQKARISSPFGKSFIVMISNCESFYLVIINIDDATKNVAIDIMIPSDIDRSFPSHNMTCPWLG